MLPIHLGVGLLLGATQPRAPRTTLGIGLVASLLWGAGVGFANESLGTLVAGVVLAGANVAVGMLVGLTIAGIVRTLRSPRLPSGVSPPMSHDRDL